MTLQLIQNQSQSQEFARAWMAPDGSCTLVGSCCSSALTLRGRAGVTSSVMRLWALGQHAPLDKHNGSMAYNVRTWRDACWFPAMERANAASCAFATCAQRVPIQLWDAYYGTRRASYVPLNAASEELAETYAIAMTTSKLVAAVSASTNGKTAALVMFDLAVPEKVSVKLDVHSSLKGAPASVDIASKASLSPFVALGLRNGDVGLFDMAHSSQKPLKVLRNVHSDGVAQVHFVNMCAGDTATTDLLVTVGRKTDNTIRVWDLRNLSQSLMQWTRPSSGTAQPSLVDSTEEALLYGDAHGFLFTRSFRSLTDELLWATAITKSARDEDHITDTPWHKTPFGPVSSVSVALRPAADGAVLCVTAGERRRSTSCAGDESDGDRDTSESNSEEGTTILQVLKAW
ncbi:hypothetical protein FVE85_9013 [Porphyridium purpureum]|uniref:Guanine nucleotide-binding protein subunit beta-like protein n=1 Tax=Porphyridium purpureum TaxID=35688 RepID=A0A5J4YML8_PORPP|nr:hypothetical protein FVE85_9013 [Porphyridium purpureum]|eukprot:POR3611..scf222_8